MHISDKKQFFHLLKEEGDSKKALGKRIGALFIPFRGELVLQTSWKGWLSRILKTRLERERQYPLMLKVAKEAFQEIDDPQIRFQFRNEFASPTEAVALDPHLEALREEQIAKKEEMRRGSLRNTAEKKEIDQAKIMLNQTKGDFFYSTLGVDEDKYAQIKAEQAADNRFLESLKGLSPEEREAAYLAEAKKWVDELQGLQPGATKTMVGSFGIRGAILQGIRKLIAAPFFPKGDDQLGAILKKISSGEGIEEEIDKAVEAIRRQFPDISDEAKGKVGVLMGKLFPKETERSGNFLSNEWNALKSNGLLGNIFDFVHEDTQQGLEFLFSLEKMARERDLMDDGVEFAKNKGEFLADRTNAFLSQVLGKVRKSMPVDIVGALGLDPYLGGTHFRMEWSKSETGDLTLQVIATSCRTIEYTLRDIVIPDEALFVEFLRHMYEPAYSIDYAPDSGPFFRSFLAACQGHIDSKEGEERDFVLAYAGKEVPAGRLEKKQMEYFSGALKEMFPEEMNVRTPEQAAFIALGVKQLGDEGDTMGEAKIALDHYYLRKDALEKMFDQEHDFPPELIEPLIGFVMSGVVNIDYLRSWLPEVEALFGEKVAMQIRPLFDLIDSMDEVEKKSGVGAAGRKEFKRTFKQESAVIRALSSWYVKTFIWIIKTALWAYYYGKFLVDVATGKYGMEFYARLGLTGAIWLTPNGIKEWVSDSVHALMYQMAKLFFEYCIRFFLSEEVGTELSKYGKQLGTWTSNKLAGEIVFDFDTTVSPDRRSLGKTLPPEKLGSHFSRPPDYPLFPMPKSGKGILAALQKWELTTSFLHPDSEELSDEYAYLSSYIRTPGDLYEVKEMIAGAKNREELNLFLCTWMCGKAGYRFERIPFKEFESLKIYDDIWNQVPKEDIRNVMWHLSALASKIQSTMMSTDQRGDEEAIVCQNELLILMDRLARRVVKEMEGLPLGAPGIEMLLEDKEVLNFHPEVRKRLQMLKDWIGPIPKNNHLALKLQFRKIKETELCQGCNKDLEGFYDFDLERDKDENAFVGELKLLNPFKRHVLQIFFDRFLEDPIKEQQVALKVKERKRGAITDVGLLQQLHETAEQCILPNTKNNFLAEQMYRDDSQGLLPYEFRLLQRQVLFSRSGTMPSSEYFTNIDRYLQARDKKTNCYAFAPSNWGRVYCNRLAQPKYMGYVPPTKSRRKIEENVASREFRDFYETRERAIVEERVQTVQGENLSHCLGELEELYRRGSSVPRISYFLFAGMTLDHQIRNNEGAALMIAEWCDRILRPSVQVANREHFLQIAADLRDVTVAIRPETASLFPDFAGMLQTDLEGRIIPHNLSVYPDAVQESAMLFFLRAPAVCSNRHESIQVCYDRFIDTMKTGSQEQKEKVIEALLVRFGKSENYGKWRFFSEFALRENEWFVCFSSLQMWRVGGREKIAIQAQSPSPSPSFHMGGKMEPSPSLSQYVENLGPEFKVECQGNVASKKIETFQISGFGSTLRFRVNELGQAINIDSGEILSGKTRVRALRGFAHTLLLEGRDGTLRALVPSGQWVGGLLSRGAKMLQIGGVLPYLIPYAADLLSTLTGQIEERALLKFTISKEGIVDSTDPEAVLELLTHALLAGKVRQVDFAFDRLKNLLRTKPVSLQKIRVFCLASFLAEGRVSSSRMRLELLALSLKNESLSKNIEGVDDYIYAGIIAFDLRTGDVKLADGEAWFVYRHLFEILGKAVSKNIKHIPPMVTRLTGVGLKSLENISPIVLDPIADFMGMKLDPKIGKRWLKLKAKYQNNHSLLVQGASAVIDYKRTGTPLDKYNPATLLLQYFPLIETDGIGLDLTIKIVELLMKRGMERTVYLTAKNVPPRSRRLHPLLEKLVLPKNVFDQRWVWHDSIQYEPTHESIPKHFFHFYDRLLKGDAPLRNQISLLQTAGNPVSAALIDLLLGLRSVSRRCETMEKVIYWETSLDVAEIIAGVVPNFAIQWGVRKVAKTLVAPYLGKAKEFVPQNMTELSVNVPYLGGMKFDPLKLASFAVASAKKIGIPLPPPSKVSVEYRNKMFTRDLEVSTFLQVMGHLAFTTEYATREEPVGVMPVGDFKIEELLRDRRHVKIRRLANPESIWKEADRIAVYERALGAEIAEREQKVLELTLKRGVNHGDLEVAVLRGELSSLLNWDKKSIEILEWEIITTLALKGRYEQLKQLVAMLDKKTIPFEDLATSMSARREIDLLKAPKQLLLAVLLFESRMGMLLWKKQIHTLEVRLEQNGSMVMELLMSLGKSTALIPSANIILADGEHAVFNIWPKPFLGMATEYMEKHMFRLAKMRQNQIPIHRGFGGVRKLQDFYVWLRHMTENKESFNTTRHDCQLLEALFINSLKEKKLEEALLLRTILKYIKTKVKFQIDEVHGEFDYRELLNLPTGPTQTLSHEECLPFKLAFRKLTREADFVRALRDGTTADYNMAALKEKLAKGSPHEHFLMGTAPWNGPKEDFAYYSTLKGLLNSLLPTTLKLSLFVDFGGSKSSNHAHPYDGNNECKEDSVFGLPQQTLVRTAVKFWVEGLAPHQIREALLSLPEAIAADRSLQFYFAGNKELGPLLQPHEREKRKAIVDAIEIKALSHDFALIEHYLFYHVIHEIKYWSQNISINFVNFGDMCLEFTGYTGTPHRSTTYPEMELIRDPGTAEEATVTLCTRCPENPVFQVSSDNPRKMLAEILSTFTERDYLLGDISPFMKGLSNREVATEMTEVARRFGRKGVLFFEKDESEIDRLQFMSVEENVVSPAAGVDLAPEDCLVYCDENHCVSTNIVLPPNAVGVFCIGPTVEHAIGTQGGYRMRMVKREKLLLLGDEVFQEGGFQQVRYALHPAFKASTPWEIMAKMKEFELGESKVANFDSNVMKMHAMPRRAALDALFESSDLLGDFEEYFSIFITEIPVDPTVLWGPVVENIPVAEALTRIATSIQKKTESHSFYPQIHKKLWALADPNRLPYPATVEMAGSGQQFDINQSVEVFSEQTNVQETENEVNIISQTETENRVAKPSILPYPRQNWPRFSTIEQPVSLKKLAAWGNLPIHTLRERMERSGDLYKQVASLFPRHVYVSDNVCPHSEGQYADVGDESQRPFFEMLVFMKKKRVKTILLNPDESSMWKERLSGMASSQDRKLFIWDLYGRVGIAGSQIDPIAMRSNAKIARAEICYRFLSGKPSLNPDLGSAAYRWMMKGSPKKLERAFMGIYRKQGRTHYQGSEMEGLFYQAKLEKEPL